MSEIERFKPGRGIVPGVLLRPGVLRGLLLAASLAACAIDDRRLAVVSEHTSELGAVAGLEQPTDAGAGVAPPGAGDRPHDGVPAPVDIEPDDSASGGNGAQAPGSEKPTAAACSAGSSECVSASALEQCTADEQWSDPIECPFVCANGVCGG